MAHELEIKANGEASMFYRGNTPWHELGTKVTGHLTVEEAINAAGLNWSVSKQPLSTPGGLVAPDHVATVRSTDNRILGVVGQKYEVLQNAKAFEFFNPFVQSGECSFETAGSLRDGSRVWILAEINRDPSVIVKGDEVKKYLLLAHSHDGSLRVQVGFTPVRVVCANTLAMSMGDKGSQLLKVKHTKNMYYTLEKIQEVINLANNQFEATAEQYRLLAKTSVKFSDLEKYVRVVFDPSFNPKDVNASLPETERKSRIFEDINRLFNEGRGNTLPGVEGTLWAAYNAITEHIVYERGNVNTSASDRLDNAWLGSGMQLNQKALQTALELVK